MVFKSIPDKYHITLSNFGRINQIIKNGYYGFKVIILDINTKAPGVFKTGGFIATLDVPDFIISS